MTGGLGADIGVTSLPPEIPPDALAASQQENQPHTIVVVCHSGHRSLMAMQFLRDAGLIQATNLIGGIDAWATTIDPSMPRY